MSKFDDTFEIAETPGTDSYRAEDIEKTVDKYPLSQESFMLLIAA